MQATEYEDLKKIVQTKKTSNVHAAFIISIMTFLTSLMIYISYTQNNVLWFLAQTVLGVLILQWFFLIHDLGHGHFFSSSKVNSIIGVFASLIVMLPFFPWKYIHRHHHVWTGWKDKDPTMSIIIPDQVPAWQKATINFCWKYWVPIFSLSFSFSNFWNLAKLKKLFPKKLPYFIFSFLIISAVHLAVIWFFSWSVYARVWVLGYFVFIIIADPLLLSQHIGIPQYHSHGAAVGQLHFREQEEFTRSLVFPKWVKTYILFGFNVHALHHLYPALPGYRLSMLEHKGQNDIHWYEWLKSAKKTPAMELLFSGEKKR